MSVLNKREYRYNSFGKNYYSHSTFSFYIDKDGYLYSDFIRNNLYLNYPIVFFYNNWNEFLTIDTDDNINIHNTSSYQINKDFKEPIYTFHPNSKPVYITGRSRNYNYSQSNNKPDVYWYENALVTCKNGSVYMFTRNSRMDDCFNIDPVMTTIGDILPEGEVTFKACLQNESYPFIILTMKGNVYYVFNNNKQSVKKLSNISNVTDIAWDSWLSYNFCITEDGSVYYNLINNNSNNFYTKSTTRIEGIDDAKEFTFHNNSSLWNLISSHTPNKFYVTYLGDLIHTFEFEENVIHSYIYNGYSIFVFEDGTMHTFHHILNGETNEWSLNDLGINQIDVTNLRNMVVEQPAPYVNIPIDYYTYTYNPAGTGLTFQYRFGLNQNISNDGSRNVVNYVAN